MRRRWLLPTGVLSVTLVAVALAAFQPWKAVLDETVVEAAPVTAAAPPRTTSPAAAPTSTAPAPSTTAAPTTTPTTPTAATTTAAAEPAPAVGTFTGKAHPTSGTVQVLTRDDGVRVLRIEDLDTSNGPDVKVVLSPDPDGYADGAVSLGTLKGNKGSQNYAVPAGTDLSVFTSVSIWCARFRVSFGAATLAT